MSPRDEPPTDLSYAPRGTAPKPQMPQDQTVLRGLTGILAAIVLLPFALGMIVILLLLLGGGEGRAGRLRSIFTVE